MVRRGFCRLWVVWLGVAATVLVVSGLVATAFVGVYWGVGRTRWSLVKGTLVAQTTRGAGAPVYPTRPSAHVLEQAGYFWWPPGGRFVQRGTTQTSSRTSTMVMVVVPLWPVPVVSALVTAVLWRRGRGRARGRVCERCGYDLTGLGGVCPECGTGAAVSAPRR